MKMQSVLMEKERLLQKEVGEKRLMKARIRSLIFENEKQREIIKEKDEAFKEIKSQNLAY